VITTAPSAASRRVSHTSLVRKILAAVTPASPEISSIRDMQSANAIVSVLRLASAPRIDSIPKSLHKVRTVAAPIAIAVNDTPIASLHTLPSAWLAPKSYVPMSRFVSQRDHTGAI
jgi:hypothetical protein